MAIQQQPAPPEDRWNARRQEWINPLIWERPDMRTALATRDVGAVYRLLQRFGVSQRRIAALVEQSQGEVSEIISGRRAVVSYDVLVRIADGLDVPRGWMGLASHATTEDRQARSSGDERPLP